MKSKRQMHTNSAVSSINTMNCKTVLLIEQVISTCYRIDSSLNFEACAAPVGVQRVEHRADPGRRLSFGQTSWAALWDTVQACYGEVLVQER